MALRGPGCDGRVPAARQGEHNARVLAEFGLTPAEIAGLKGSRALVQHEQRIEAAAAGLSNPQGKESR